MRFEIRPLENAALARNDKSRRPAQFRADWRSTLDLLKRETAYLGASLVVLQVDVIEGDLRRDGMLRANAKVYSPAVRVSFDSRHGHLTYTADRYDWWQDNVRAIALALQALRAVDRYGVTHSGEQYTGWLAIETGAAPTTAEAARTLLDSYGGEAAALKRTHPDLGGDPAEFRRVQAARELLASANGATR